MPLRRGTRRHAARAAGAHDPSGGRIFLIGFLAFFAASAVWSFATPIFGAPDEPTHVVKAAAVVRGEWTGIFCYSEGVDKPCVPTPPNSALGLVTVPAFYALLRWPAMNPATSQICFHARATQPASCAQSVNTQATPSQVAAGATREAWIYDARYPPLYYAIVGLPTLLGGSSGIIYLMRLVSGALSAVFLALALAVAIRYSVNRFLVLGLLVATTPMVIYLAAVVNPSGLEVSSAVCVLTAGAVLVTERHAAPPRGLVAILAGSAAVLELTRSLSPFWLLLSALFLLGFAQLRALRRAFTMRFVQLAFVGVVAVGALGVAWTVTQHATLVYAGQCLSTTGGSFSILLADGSTAVVAVSPTTSYVDATAQPAKPGTTRTVCVGDTATVTGAASGGSSLLASAVTVGFPGTPPPATAAAAAAFGTVVSTTTLPASTSEATILEAAFQHNVYNLEDMVGVFGWFDTISPYGTYVIWYGLVGALVLAAAVIAGRRRVAVLGLLAVAIVLLPVLISSSQARRYGYVWSGRDTLPLAVALPLLAAACGSTLPAAARLFARRAVLVAGLLAAVAQFAAFFEALRRYAVGTSGPNLGFLTHPSWRPPIGVIPAVVLELVALVLLYGVLAYAAGLPIRNEHLALGGLDATDGVVPEQPHDAPDAALPNAAAPVVDGPGDVGDLPEGAASPR